MEAEAILGIIDRIQSGYWEMVLSTALQSEISRTSNLVRKQQVLNLLAIAKIEVTVTEIHIKRAHNLQDLGFQAFDALHLACAEAARCRCLPDHRRPAITESYFPL